MRFVFCLNCSRLPLLLLSVLSLVLVPLAGCSQDPGEALTPSPSPSSSPSNTPAASPTARPTETPEGEVTPTPRPSPTPSPTPTATPVPVPEPVEVLIDDSGVAHLYAQNDLDLFYAAGYQLATDRLYQMETLRRFALGRLAEVLGEEGLYRDLESRTFDFPRWGRLDYEAMQTADPERVALLRAWVRGINARIQEVREGTVPLPFGYGIDGWDFLPEPWEDVDPYIILKGAGFALDLTLTFEYALTVIYGLYPEAMASVEVLKPAHQVYSVPEAERPPLEGAARRAPKMGRQDVENLRKILPALGKLLPAFPRASGSNNWAMDGRHTLDGKPLLAGDPHLSFDFFGAPYPLHLNSADAGGSYDVAGFAYPGTPGIAIGHNRHAIWSPTSAFGDVMDVWSLKTRGNQADIGGEWKPLISREEQIIVRDPGKPAGEGQVVTQVYQEVEGYGVIVPPEVLGLPTLEPLLCNWTGFTGRPARWFMELNRVSSLDDFEQAVDRMREMNYNFVGATAEGISLRVGLDIPVRQDVSGDRGPWKAMDGSDPLTYWPGPMLPADKLPHSRGQTLGWLATANNDPYGFTEDGRIDTDPWFYGAFFDPGYRAARATSELSRLAEQGSVTLEDMQSLQMDTHSTLADDLLPLLTAAYAKVETDPDLREFRNNEGLEQVVSLLTTAWDRRMATDSAGALVFHAFLHFAVEETLRDDIPLAYDFAVELQAIYVMKIAVLALQGAYPQGAAVVQDGVDVTVLNAAVRTVEWLEAEYGSVEPVTYAYGNKKVTSFDDAYGYLMPLFDRPSPGGEDTICVSQNIAFAEDAAQWTSTYVSVERMVGGFAADGTPEAWVNFPVGVAADPGSEDTARANADYLAGRYHKFLFRRDEIEAALREQRLIQP